MGFINVSAVANRKELGATDMAVYEGEHITGVDPILDKVAALFLSKTNGRSMMRRSEYDPLDFSEQLPDLDIYDFSNHFERAETSAPFGSATVSFSGSHSAAFYGECTGKHLSDIEPGEVSQRAIEICNIINRTKSPVVTVVTPRSESIENQVIYMFIMPLTDETDKINGACVYHVLKRRTQSAA